MFDQSSGKELSDVEHVNRVGKANDSFQALQSAA